MNIIKYKATPTSHTYVGCVLWVCGRVLWVWLLSSWRPDNNIIQQTDLTRVHKA